MNITLREYRDTDWPAIEAWARNIASDAFMSRFQPVSSGNADRTVSTTLMWRIIFSDGQAVGTIWLEPSNNTDECKLGIFLGNSSIFGKGIGTAAIGLCLREAKETSTWRKVLLNVRANNHRAIACYRKCGFEVLCTRSKVLASGERVVFHEMVLHL